MGEACDTVGHVQALARASLVRGGTNRGDDMGYSLPLRAGLRAALLLSAALMFLAVARTAQADTVAFSTIDKSDLAGIDACGPNCFNMIGASGGGSPVQTFT